ncbi:MAG TPA: glycosyltransferase family 39 protein [Nitrospirota bacterium]|nr:glycosyltransferase family 39 protein [Nitrospirota bacterium]
METVFTKRNTIIFVGLLILWKIYVSATLQLHPDEAYYWMWSRHLDLGYFDHAPLIAYAIRLTTLFSQQELWVRFTGILGTLVTSVTAWVLAMQLFHDRKIASASVITLNVLPVTLPGSILITPDIPAFLFWGLTVFFYWQIVATGKVRYWYFMGIAFGLSLLSKYTGVLIGPCLFLFMLLTDERKWFKTVHPYAAFVLGCAFFLPVLYWNSKHQWISFAYQLGHGLGGANYSLGKELTYLGGQMLVASPFLWLLGTYASVLYLFQKNREKLFLSLTSLPIILFFAYSSLKSVAQANWPTCAYFTFSILVSHYLFNGAKLKKHLWAGATLFSLLLCLAAMLHATFSILPLEKISKSAAEADATQWFYGWRELGEELEKDPSVKYAIAESHQVGAEISYYTKERIFAYVDYNNTKPNQFNLWTFPEELKDKKGVAVFLEGHSVLPYSRYFTSVGSMGSLTVKRDDLVIRTYHIVSGTGYIYPPAPSL